MKKGILIIYLSLVVPALLPGYTASAQKKAPIPVQVNFHDIIGKWKYIKSLPYSMYLSTLAKPASTQPASAKPASPHDTATKKAETQKTTQPLTPEEKNKRIEMKKSALSVKSSGMEFLPDKTAMKTYPDKTEKYTWKEKKNNTMIITNLTTKEKIKTEVLKLKNDTLQLLEHLSSGDVYVLYLRAPYFSLRIQWDHCIRQ